MVSLASMDTASGVIAPGGNGSLKRKQTDIFDSESLHSSQVKRRRVTFDPSVDVHILPDVNEKSLELVGEEVRSALERHASGDNRAYDQIRVLLDKRPTSADAPLSRFLHKYIIAFTNNVPLLDHGCTGLVHAIVDSSWIGRNEQYVRAYRHLLHSLLSVHPGYTSSVLTMLVNMFLELPSPAIRQQDDPPIQKTRLQLRVHESLRHILRQNPMTSTFLAPILASTFPFPTDSVKAHVQYIGNMLRVSEYCPELKGEILSLIMDKLVKIDVQIQVEVEELGEGMEELLEDMTDDEEDHEDSSDDESVSSEESLPMEERREKEFKESLRKLDAIMDLLFAHYDAVFASGDLFAIDEAFENLLSQFASIILPTYRSRHVQFLLFHFSQLSPDLMERFAGCCSHLAFEPGQPHILRVAAASYLASFIARGAHVSSAVVRDVFDLLCHHLDTIRAAQELSCKAPDLRRYGTYYAICQALLYAFCFRWRDLIVTDDGKPLTDEQVLYHEGDFRWYSNTQEILRRNIFSKLNPLKICAPSIVEQFDRVATHLRFLYVHSKLETNKRIRLARNLSSGYMDGIGARETALTMKKGEGTFLLDAYFPFDPYNLRKSKGWVEPDFVAWRPVPGMEPIRDDEEEADDDEDEDEDEDEESGPEEEHIPQDEDDMDGY